MLRQWHGLSPLVLGGRLVQPLTIFGSCDHLVLAVWLSFTLPLFEGATVLDSWLLSL